MESRIGFEDKLKPKLPSSAKSQFSWAELSYKIGFRPPHPPGEAYSRPNLAAKGK